LFDRDTVARFTIEPFFLYFEVSKIELALSFFFLKNILLEPSVNFYRFTVDVSNILESIFNFNECNLPLSFFPFNDDGYNVGIR
jgi:hypothetical protein